VAFLVAVRDASCFVYLQACRMVVLDRFQDETIRIELADRSGPSCASDQRCEVGHCVAGGEVDGGVVDAAQLDTSAPDVSAPDALAPDALAPDASQPDGSAPDAARPDTAAPDTSLPDTSPPPPILTLHHTGTAGLNAAQSQVIVDLDPAVDESASLLVFSATTDSISPSYGHVSGQLQAAGSEVRFARWTTGGGFTVDISWSVVELDGLEVQRGSYHPGTPTLQHIPLSPSVDLARTFPCSSIRSSGSHFNPDDWYAYGFSDSDSLYVESTTDPENSWLEWQAVQLPAVSDAAVYAGVTALAVGEQTLGVPIGASVDPAHAFLLFTYKVFDTEGARPIAHYTITGYIAGADQLQFDRLNADRAASVSWYVVSWDRLHAQHGAEIFTPGQQDRTVDLSATVDPDRSIAFTPAYQRGGTTDFTSDDPAGAAWFTLSIISGGAQLELHRGDGRGNAAVDWSVVEFQ
jgi:hypothetical protein